MKHFQSEKSYEEKLQLCLPRASCGVGWLLEAGWVEKSLLRRCPFSRSLSGQELARRTGSRTGHSKQQEQRAKALGMDCMRRAERCLTKPMLFKKSDMKFLKLCPPRWRIRLLWVRFCFKQTSFTPWNYFCSYWLFLLLATWWHCHTVSFHLGLQAWNCFPEMGAHSFLPC